MLCYFLFCKTHLYKLCGISRADRVGRRAFGNDTSRTDNTTLAYRDSLEYYASCADPDVIFDNDILVTTLDYQNWDRENDENNDESYFVKKYRDKIEGGVVISVSVTPLYDVEIIMDNGIKIESFVKNGYHHFDDENEQWVFFRKGDHSHPFISVWSKSVDIATTW